MTELSNGYLNATKDRMYFDEPEAKSRRSAVQTCWYYLIEMLLRDLQPILAFTTDEVMAHLPESARDGQQFAAVARLVAGPASPTSRSRSYSPSTT